MLCPAASPLSHLQPFLYPQSLFPDCFLFLQHSHYSFSALSEEKLQRKIDIKQILSSSRAKDEGSRWGKHEQGAQWGCTRVRKPHIVTPLPFQEQHIQGSREMPSCRQSSIVGVASGTKPSNMLEKPKGKSRIISLIIPSAKDWVL